MTATVESLEDLVTRFKQDPESVYNIWFRESPARLKAFRSIRRGILEVIHSINQGTFGNDFKGSPLETVLTSITEQKQVFEGAAHAFYWKPKLRIPDIYENEENKRAFGQFLECFLSGASEERLIREILDLDRKRIKGLGPAVANILYFLHPTLFPPFNTAIVRGYNLLFADSKPLGSWPAYLEMREVMRETNDKLEPTLSKDQGAFAGLLFDIGVGKLMMDANCTEVLIKDRQAVEKALRKRHQDIEEDRREEDEHLKIQYLLTTIGRALRYQVHVALNDRGKRFGDESLASLTLETLPPLGLSHEVEQTIRFIDVIWFSPDGKRIICAFEVEKSTSIYSGILRLMDLGQSLADADIHFYLVAPDARQREVQAQLRRPAFAHLAHLKLRYLLFSTLCEHCSGLCKFGENHLALLKIARGRA